ncbi:MAG: hypothetical protein COB67_10290 [SAR324 cluster bacterium]|uniref:T6SS Phospholipase effector Tle1-like catalytic domain-containing protein n=1 Tax=SAR324 cluster bacterium TaxID=2024889 RepID=A0A2A4SXP7_9DELT|nr:MAG: hypothetical protein COB67_10290 [SAR324 cluster bacterium]
MSNESKRATNGVVFENNKMMFIVNTLTDKESSKNSMDECVNFGAKNRWVYLAVGYKESESLRSKHSDAEALLNAIKDEYEPYLKQSIATQDGITLSQVKDGSVNKNNKQIYLKESDVCATNSIKEVLQANDMHTKANKLEEEHSKEGARTTRMTLSFTRQEAQELIRNDHVFAIVALAYGYNGKDDALSIFEAPNTQVAFIPRTRLECGVFFDGTNNNKHNTEMRLAYEEYFYLKSRMMTGENRTTTHTWETKILDKDTPDSEILPLIFEDLKDYMVKKNIYGKKRSSLDKYNDGIIFGIGQNDVSADCDAIYEYFKESKMQEALKEIEKIQKKRIPFEQKQKETETAKEEFKLTKQTVAYIEKEILISGKDSSYTGALSNVAKLHKVYDTSVTKTTHKDADLFECFRESIYITGAGTHSDNKDGDHESDDLFLGQALAIGNAGVRAKVNNACKDLHSIVSNLDTDYIDTLVLDVFGFSRGAAEARHFVSKLCEGLECTFERTIKDKKDYTEYELTKAGANLYPHILKEKESEKDKVIIDKIVFRFIGVFDTVPHEGLFQGNDAKDLGLKLYPKKVSQVVHLTAKDEFRYNFDLVSIFPKHQKDDEGNKEEGNFIEKEFFGAHSDVGGGYRDDISEEVQLPTQIRRLHSSFDDENKYDAKIIAKIKKWNAKHHWIKDLDDSKIINIKYHKDMGKTDGFYIKKRVYKKQHDITVVYKVYMFRDKVDTEYSQIPLEYMYKKIRDVLPMKELNGLTYKDEASLVKSKVLNADPQHYKEIKSQFFHHSSSVGVAHKANRGEENIMYGKRDIHYV